MVRRREGGQILESGLGGLVVGSGMKLEKKMITPNAAKGHPISGQGGPWRAK